MRDGAEVEAPDSTVKGVEGENYSNEDYRRMLEELLK